MRPALSFRLCLGDIFRAGPSAPRRALSTSPVVPSPSPYPFSSTAVFPPSTLPDAAGTRSSPPPANLLHPRAGSSVVSHVNASLKTRYDPGNLLGTLFARRSPQRLRTGSVVSVLSYTSSARTGVAPFSGVLMRVRRRGVDTAFTLRNVVQKTGVEMSFKVCSPTIKEIKVIRRAQGRKGGIRDLRRARVNYLRDRPAVMTQIASALKQAQAART